MDKDFWSGLRLVVAGLIDAAKEASFSLGLGAGGLGGALVVVSKLGISGPAAMLISMSAFFILARIGKAVDDYSVRKTSRAGVFKFLERRFESKLEQGFEQLRSQIKEELRYRMKWDGPDGIQERRRMLLEVESIFSERLRKVEDLLLETKSELQKQITDPSKGKLQERKEENRPTSTQA